ncbi:MAG: NAD-dependent epimerase/dehydratase family protein [Clostridiales bacterium]|nr:NAD-dependent epimerase/dehydratase family protein [Clostridiales bacterium]
MDVLLVGGASSLMNAMIDKLNKEGHRIYVLTEHRFRSPQNRKVFEYYYFPYDSDCLKEVFESINPQLILCMGAFDINYDWTDTRKESVRYSLGITNILTAFAAREKGRLVYLSSDEVYGDSYTVNITEDTPASARGFRAMVLAQMEQQCKNYSRQMDIDAVVLRLDHLYAVPRKARDCTHIGAKMCIEGLKSGKISASDRYQLSMLHLQDAVDFIYQVCACESHQKPLYNLSSSKMISQMEIAQILRDTLGGDTEIEDNSVGSVHRVVLSNEAFASEFHQSIRHEPQETFAQMATYMKKHRNAFLTADGVSDNFLNRFLGKSASLFWALLPFAENLICFIPFFMLNNRATDSKYFAKLDFYLLYVLLFAIVHGQQQATFSALLSILGYVFRQMYNRSGFEVLMDYNTYVWIAQLFIIGLIVGYMKDRLNVMQEENRQEMHYMEGRLDDISDINTSNAKMKNLLADQIINEEDSLGKVYEVTSRLNNYEPEEVLFYAADIVAKLMGSKDVAIYTIANRSYARLYSSTSTQARVMGKSIQYTEMDDLSEALKERRVYINKKLDERYPMMAYAIYSEDEMQLILMVWGLPWERMTLAQADTLSVISDLIQNAVLRANRYLEALEDRRYISGTPIMEEESFTKLVRAYLAAQTQGLTECALVAIDTGEFAIEEAAVKVRGVFRQTDYLGEMNGKLYLLLSNATEQDAGFVLERIRKLEMDAHVQKGIDL